MKFALAALALGAAIVSTAPAQAKGCLKGAAVGGIAGHMAGHGVLGAAAGCAVGRHEANKADRQRAADQARSNQSAPATSSQN